MLSQDVVNQSDIHLIFDDCAQHKRDLSINRTDSSHITTIVGTFGF